jgi:hypothetical protein
VACDFVREAVVAPGNIGAGVVDAVNTRLRRGAARGKEAVPEGAKRFALPLFGGVIPVVREDSTPSLVDPPRLGSSGASYHGMVLTAISQHPARVSPLVLLAPVYRLSGRSWSKSWAIRPFAGGLFGARRWTRRSLTHPGQTRPAAA